MELQVVVGCLLEAQVCKAYLPPPQALQDGHMVAQVPGGPAQAGQIRPSGLHECEGED